MLKENRIKVNIGEQGSGRKVIFEFQKKIKQIKKLNLAGLLAGGHIVKNSSMRKTPIDEGNLVGSTYVESNRNESNPDVEIGVDTDYAVYVHENLEARHTVGEAKFLEKAITETLPQVLSTIKRFIKV